MRSKLRAWIAVGVVSRSLCAVAAVRWTDTGKRSEAVAKEKLGAELRHRRRACLRRAFGLGAHAWHRACLLLPTIRSIERAMPSC